MSVQLSNVHRSHTQPCGIVWALSILILLLAIYDLILIWRSSFLIGGERTFCLFDDAMISMTYARNWAQGNGILWNAGEEPVEGYTNFGWVAVMALIHKIGLSPSGTCLAVQILGLILGCCYVIGAAWLGRMMHLSNMAVIAGGVLVVLFYNLTFLSIMGMETGLLAVILTLCLAAALWSAERGRFPVVSVLLLGVAGLVRTDVIICLPMIVLPALLKQRKAGARISARALLALLALIPILLLTLWRHAYYGDWLPNTYYAKMSGWPLDDRILRGLVESIRTLARLVPAIVVFVPCAVIGSAMGPRLVLGVLVTLLFYQMWAGGDVWQLDRFVCPIVPALFMCAAGAVVDEMPRLGTFRKWMSSRRFASRLLQPFLLIVIVAVANKDSWHEALLLDEPRCRSENLMNMERARTIERAIRPGGVVGLYFAGVMPYFVPGQYVDFLGKSDRYIAGLPVKRRWLEHRALTPGHNKWSWKYAIGQRKPDIVTRNDGQLLLYSRDFQNNYYKYCLKSDAAERVPFWVRKDSQHVRWSRIRLAADASARLPTVLDDP